jgi:hypothetical protein
MSSVSAARTFNKMEELLWNRALAHYNRGGGELEELFQIACWYLLEAVRTYDPSRGTKLSTHVWNRVEWGLLDHRKSERVCFRRGGVSLQKLLSHPGSEERWFTDPVDRPAWINLVHSFSEQTKSLVTLLLDAPAELQACLKSGARPVTQRNQLRRYLLAQGWALQQIADSFSELQAAFGEPCHGSQTIPLPGA